MAKESEPILWINHRELLKISRKLGPSLSGCHFELVTVSAEANGRISENEAIAALAAIVSMNEESARQAISDLIAAGMMTLRDGILTLAVYDSVVVPDYDDWN